MYTADKELFKKALLEATVNKYEREMAACTASADCTPEHYKRMSRIIGVNVAPPATRKRFSKRAVVAIILAAALLLSGCTVIYAYRNEICDFIERFYEKHMAVSVDSGTPQVGSREISEVYALTYVPEGYAMTDERIEPMSVFYEFANSDNRLITFKQKRLEISQFYMDAQNDGATVIEHDEYRIYYRQVNAGYHYIWCDETYAMVIKSDVALSEDVLAQMIDGVTEKP